jgi:hypothetical protein
VLQRSQHFQHRHDRQPRLRLERAPDHRTQPELDPDQRGIAARVDERQHRHALDRCGHGRRLIGRLHGADEAVTGAVQRLDQWCDGAVIADRAAHFHDAARHHRVGDELARPHMLQQLVAADHALVVLHQVGQHVEHARLEVLRLAADAELARRDAQLASTETQRRLGWPRIRRRIHGGDCARRGASIRHGFGRLRA